MKQPDKSGYYRSFVGPEDKYDIFSAVQFNLLTSYGLREENSLLDIGCGSLRSGRLFIPYLLPEKYHGIEPHDWLVQEGITNQVGRNLIEIKKPVFIYDDDFSFTRFGKSFDFLLAHSIFSHATQQQIKKCFSEAAKVMKPASIFLATFVEGENNYEGDKWSIWAVYQYEFIRQAALEEGLSCKKIDWPSPDFQTWILLSKQEDGNGIYGGQISASQELINVKNELKFCKEKLMKLEHNPLIRLMIAVNRLVKLFGFFIHPWIDRFNKR
jgi:SAM-dependent methyltransferase